MQFVFGLFAVVSILVYILPTALLTLFWEIELTVPAIFELIGIGAVFYIISMMTLMIKNVENKAEPSAPAKETTTEKSALS